ncbi:Protein of unknown function [Gryllus bimaculatus]|nr:Protein of unknown function [Gryllus bimaculatus]
MTTLMFGGVYLFLPPGTRDIPLVSANGLREIAVGFLHEVAAHAAHRFPEEGLRIANRCSSTSREKSSDTGEHRRMFAIVYVKSQK